ncbi:MAG: ATP-binding cassette domain-containing protein [Archangium sp.]|nr:ATP-binding cassette domain-containing protein [Archangium sp.]
MRALHDVSLEFAVGSRTVLWGPAGGGKTSLLKCLTGLQFPTQGEVKWNDQPVQSRSATERREAQVAFGMVFQSDALFDSLSVIDNVLLPLRKRHVPEKDALERATETLERVGLSHAILKRPENLSGGMKKRAGVARAIVARPAVLIADDPFAGLDPVTEQSIADLLMEVSEGRTLIVALPDPVGSLPIERQVRFVNGAVAS